MPTEPMPTDPTTPEPMSPESTTAAATTKNRKEPAYLFSEKQVAEKCELARRFLDNRTRLNENVHKADNLFVKRFYILDHNTYLEGALPAKYKELIDRKSTRLNSSHLGISYAVFCLKKKK